MTTFLDFKEVKERVRLGHAISWLDLTLKQHGNQWRGSCPTCGGGERSLVITEGKGYFCFTSKKGGDVIGLVSHLRDLSARDAAGFLAERAGIVQGHNSTVNRNGTVTAPQGEAGKEKGQPQPSRVLTPLSYLEATHEAVQALGVEPATAQQFGAGWAGKGIMRGRFAVPIQTRLGELVAYVGIAVTDDQAPRLLFPNGFDPRGYVWNAHRVDAGDVLYAVTDPLQALLAVQNGAANVVSFFGDITPDSLDSLSLLMTEKEIPSVEFF